MFNKKASKEDSELDLEISRNIIASLSNESLLNAQKFLEKMAEYKRIKKLYDTYIEGVETSLENTGNGRMYVIYNIDGAVTGRLSNSGANSEKGGGKESKLGVSFHTLPREQIDFNIRDYVVAPDGWDFITADLKAAELRVLAHVANERNMIKAFSSGLDLHQYSAAMTFNKDPKDVTKLERQIAKEVSFLTVYGGTAYTLAAKRRISEERANDIIQGWMDAYPGVGQYMGTVDSYIQQHKYAKTIFGRRRNLPNIDSPFKGVRKRAFRQGLNFTIQSPASDILLCCLLGIDLRLKALGLRAKIVATVHDSIELISPKDETARVVEIIIDEITNYRYLKDNFGIVLRVPLVVDVEVGTSFGNGKPYHPH
jgi:DNA polymerase-1